MDSYIGVHVLVFKCLNGLSPQEMGLQYKGFNGRPDDFLLLQTPNFRTLYGKRIFAFHGSRMWNALPVNIRAENNIEKLKKYIKTLLFERHDEFRMKAFRYKQEECDTASHVNSGATVQRCLTHEDARYKYVHYYYYYYIGVCQRSFYDQV